MEHFERLLEYLCIIIEFPIELQKYQPILHTSFQGNLMNFLPVVQNITNMIIVGNLNVLRGSKFLNPSPPIENAPI